MTHVAFGHAPQSRKAEDTPWNRNESVLPRRILNSKQKDLRTLEERQFRRRQENRLNTSLLLWRKQHSPVQHAVDAVNN